ncbi:MAG: dockerin type I domain-containing protein [Planctomycetota bacterium]|nr:dockerin type I domain-containing protein [Planctomycetota bacterium]
MRPVIFTEDQVAPGDHPLVGLLIEVPDFLEPGTVIPILLANVQFFNYDFSIPTLETIDGSITVFRTADLNENGLVDSADLGLMTASWGAVKKSAIADLNGDGMVNGLDLGRLLDRWATEG